MEILEQKITAAGNQGGVELADALTELVKKEKYLALEKHDWRYDVGVKYGLLTAQMALALNGQDKDEVLTTLLELLAAREMGQGGNS
jgi:UTP--glucose-1-phosphate uridylyltransferase